MNNKNTLFQVAALVLALYIIKKLFDFFKSPQTTTTGGQTQEAVQIDPSKLTYDDAVYQTQADNIEAAVWGGLLSVTEDDEAIFDALNKMQTLDDVKRLIQVYGIRGEGIILQEYYNLPQTITMYLDNDYKEQINSIYLQRGINFTF
jgi:hypothetical protein